MRYELIIYWSKEDQSFLVEVPELPGFMANGASYEAAAAIAQAVIADWIETAKSLNRPSPLITDHCSLGTFSACSIDAMMNGGTCEACQ